MSGTADPADMEIRRSTTEDFDSFYECFAGICLERRYLALAEPPPVEAARAFMERARNLDMIQFVAVASARVVGWCDVIPFEPEGFRHAGRLGMGLVPAYRGQGIGTRLLDATVTAAREAGLRRIELEVFSTNTRAIALYERYGFAHEGVKRGGRVIDGRVEDLVLMGLLFGDSKST